MGASVWAHRRPSGKTPTGAAGANANRAAACHQVGLRPGWRAFAPPRAAARASPVGTSPVAGKVPGRACYRRLGDGFAVAVMGSEAEAGAGL
jgi:hypothetical protein